METPLLVVHGHALKLLSMFVDPAFTEQQRYARLLEMKPRDEDFARVFKPALVDKARALYTSLWQNPPPLRGKPDQVQIWIRTATTEDFVAWNRTGQEFPGGYRKLAPDLQPGIAWVAFKFVAAGDFTGLSFDGVTWFDERFVWFPQPWRLVPI